MGILNLTPDSFFDGGKYQGDEVLAHAKQLIQEGAAIIDVGAMSSRPGSTIISDEEEAQRLLPVLRELIHAFPQTIFSVDTLHAATAHEALQAGAHIINDISGGSYDPQMYAVVAASRAAYVAMHMQGLPATMQQAPAYEHVVTEVFAVLAARVQQARTSGIQDVVVDPGFGFGKTMTHNYALLKHLRYFQQLGVPVLAGVSRKGMISKPLGITAAEALNGTTALHMMALQQGVQLLRVHDVRAAAEAVMLWTLAQ
ncbi:MAG: dihydropteroate synthase [Chitinophagales bacterium]